MRGEEWTWTSRGRTCPCRANLAILNRGCDIPTLRATPSQPETRIDFFSVVAAAVCLGIGKSAETTRVHSDVAVIRPVIAVGRTDSNP
jgi:hypothetical protein